MHEQNASIGLVTHISREFTFAIRGRSCLTQLSRIASTLMLVVTVLAPAPYPLIATISSQDGLDPSKPSSIVPLVFIHHSVGYDWLRTGGLLQELNDNNYYVSETDYGWGPSDLDTRSGNIGDYTDIGHWYNWFLGPHSGTYLDELYAASWTIDGNTVAGPGGDNIVVLFKSCFVSIQAIHGDPDDQPLSRGSPNPIWGHGADEDYDESMYTVGNIKGLYRDLLDYFAVRQDKLFVLITSPPSIASDTTPVSAANLRAIHNWLVNDWLDSYPHRNVFVFDYYNVLTSNGGSYDVNDAGAESGNHHRYWNGRIQHVVNYPSNYLAYPSGGGSDSHPTAAGHAKATDEFTSLLNIAYNRWKSESPAAFYVSTSGADTNEGSLNSPWRTVQHALDVLQPGQTVYVRGGVYNEYIEFRRSGLLRAPITVSGYPGESAILDGKGLDWKYGVNLEGFDHLVVQNLTIRDYERDGLRGFGVVGWGDTDDIILRDLDVSLVEVPIKMAADGSSEVRSGIVVENVVASEYEGGGIDLGPGKVSDVTISRVTLEGPVGGSDTAVDGIAVENGDEILVEKAVIRGHPGDGVDLKADNVLVRQVDARGYARNGLKLWGTNSTAENCIFVEGYLAALVLEGDGPYAIRHCLFSILAGHGYTAVIGDYESPGRAPPVQVSLTGNIFYTTENTGTLVYFSSAILLQSDYSLYYAPQRSDEVLAAFPSGEYATFSSDNVNDGTWSAAMGTDVSSRYADPLFTDASAGDYELQEGSPAIDKIPTPLAPPVDLLGRPRPQGGGADIGPYEYVSDFVDNIPPMTSDDYDNTWRTSDFTVTLTSIDSQSGVADVYYRVNNGATQGVDIYGQPLMTVEGANNELEYWGVDNAGNEENHHIRSGIRLDKTAPTISILPITPDTRVQPNQPVTVSADVTDTVSQVRNVTLYYTLNNTATWEDPIPTDLSPSTGLYGGTIPGQPAGTWVNYRIVAYDIAGNEAALDSIPYFVGQQVPQFPSTIAVSLPLVMAMLVAHYRSRLTKDDVGMVEANRGPEHNQSQAIRELIREGAKARAWKQGSSSIARIRI